MLLQTNSYVVPKEKRAEHARLMRRFRQVLNRLGCDSFEVYEQVGANWSNTQSSGRFVQIMRFRDRKHQLAVQGAERSDPTAQELIAEFCDLVNYPLQQQQGQFAVGFYNSVLPVSIVRTPLRPGEIDPGHETHAETPEVDPAAAEFGAALVTTESFDTAAVDPAAPHLSEAEAEAAADDFAAHAEQLEAGAGQSDESSLEESAPAEPAAATAPEDDDTTLPTLETEAPLDAPPEEPAGPHEASEETATPDEPAHAPAPENGEFDLDDLDAAEGDLEITDDDLARLAQELSHDQNNGKNGPHTPGPR